MSNKEEQLIEYLPDDFSQAPYPINPNSGSDEVYSDLMREERIANIISQLNPDVIIDEVEHRLKGLRRDRQTGSWKPISETVKPLSPLLISDFIGFLSAILNTGTTFSNLSKEEINRIMNLIVEWTVDSLQDNEVAYNIVDNPAEKQRVFLMICSTCFFCFKRAQDGMEARRFFSALKVNENSGAMIPQQQQKKGLLEHFKFW